LHSGHCQSWLPAASLWKLVEGHSFKLAISMTSNTEGSIHLRGEVAVPAIVSAFAGSYLMIGTKQPACLRPLVSYLRHYRPVGNSKGDRKNLWLRLSELLRLSAWLPPSLALVWLATLATLIHNVGITLAAWGATLSLVVLVVLMAQRHASRRARTPDNAAAPKAATAQVAGPSSSPAGLPTGHGPQTPAAVAVGGSQLQVLTAEEVASVLRVDIGQVISSIAKGELPGNRLGGHWRVDHGALVRWLQGPYGDLAGHDPKR
jgi:excisionase family DNA binding protein